MTIEKGTLCGMEKKLSDDIKVGGFGACLTEDENYDYYLFKITEKATKVKKDADLEVGDGSKVNVCEGDWICRGIWMDKLRGAKNW